MEVKKAVIRGTERHESVVSIAVVYTPPPKK